VSDELHTLGALPPGIEPLDRLQEEEDFLHLPGIKPRQPKYEIMVNFI
jgi:hypothetical protein